MTNVSTRTPAPHTWGDPEKLYSLIFWFADIWMTIVSTNIPPHTRGDLEKFIFFFNQIFFSLEWSNEAKIFVASKGHKNLQNESLERHDKLRLSLMSW